MRGLPIALRLFVFTLAASVLLCAAPSKAQRATADDSGPFPTVSVVPISRTPLIGRPYVFALDHRSPSSMNAEDAAAVSSLSDRLSARASLLHIDLASPGWEYRQIVCPAFPDYVFLSYSHGPTPRGSSRFVAALPRDGGDVRIVSSASHGSKAFGEPPMKPATYQVFNQILRRERGDKPMGAAPNWLVIGMCYAEMTGDPVQVMTARPLPDSGVDMDRLNANQPQMVVSPGGGAVVTFSDLSRPSVTMNWELHFNGKGQLTAVEQVAVRQPRKIALRP